MRADRQSISYEFGSAPGGYCSRSRMLPVTHSLAFDAKYSAARAISSGSRRSRPNSQVAIASSSRSISRRQLNTWPSNASECVTGSILDLEQYPPGALPNWWESIDGLRASCNGVGHAQRILIGLLLLPQAAAAATVPLDERRAAGPDQRRRARRDGDHQRGRTRRRAWRATFSLDPAKPLDHVHRRRHRCRRPRRASLLSGRDRQTPRRMVCVLRRSDVPPGGTRGTCRGTLQCAAPSARSMGERVEIVFDGFAWAASTAGIAYTFYPGSRLIQQEAVLTTDDPDVAYYYDAGLEMAAPADRRPGNNMQHRRSPTTTPKARCGTSRRTACRPNASRCRRAIARWR